MRFIDYVLTLFTLPTLFIIKADDCIGPISNKCVQFSISSGTGCAWMCNYCANQLETNNYYFIDGVCSYQQGQGCVGNPIAGKTYTCCATSIEEITTSLA